MRVLELCKRIKRVVCEQHGQGMVEYSLILALVSIAAMVALTGVGEKVNDIYTAVTSALTCR